MNLPLSICLFCIYFVFLLSFRNICLILQKMFEEQRRNSLKSNFCFCARLYFLFKTSGEVGAMGMVRVLETRLASSD